MNSPVRFQTSAGFIHQNNGVWLLAIRWAKTRRNVYVAFASIAAKSDWLAAANCLALAFKRTETNVNDVVRVAIMSHAYSFGPGSTGPLSRHS